MSTLLALPKDVRREDEMVTRTSSATMSVEFEAASDDNIASREFAIPPRASVPFKFLTRPPIFRELDIYQHDSVTHSLDRFVASFYEKLPSTLSVHRSYEGETTRFFISAANDDEETMEQIFEPERFFYTRFSGDHFDFQVLLGADSGALLPSNAKLIWQR